MQESEFSSENQFKENELSKPDMRTGLFYECKHVDEMTDLLAGALKEGPLDAAIFKEFDLDTGDVLKNVEKLRSISEEKKIDLIIAASNMGFREEKKINWGEIKKKLENGNVELEETNFPEDKSPDTFGFVFQKDSSVFVFPKSWEKKALHRIPKTNEAVSICGEIDHIKPEDLEGINLIYNPSAEGDDLLISTRMKVAEMKKKSQSVDKEAIEKILKEDRNFGYLNQTEAPLSEERIEKEMKMWEFTRELTIKIIKENQERNRTRFVEEADKLHKQAYSRHLSSTYGSQINGMLAQKNVPVIRCDLSPETSGVLNPEIKDNIKRSDYQRKFTRITISSKEK